jgi:lysophospholipid acyltransferase (LPLAT)-like uncharacterized protein
MTDYTVQTPEAESEIGRVSRELVRIAELAAQSPKIVLSDEALGRNRWTRAADRVFEWVRTHARPIHHLSVLISAVFVFLYARIAALTIRLTRTGARKWPDLAAPGVLAVWHGSAPSLLVAVVACRPAFPVTIMIARDARGDFLALLCRMLGLKVVRGDSTTGGWEALASLADEIIRGACALITADGGGPARSAKLGSVALSAATHLPLVAIGAACRPAIEERGKWDSARNPLPFGRIAIATGDSFVCPTPTDYASLETARTRLQSALEEASAAADDALGRRGRGETSHNHAIRRAHFLL